MAFTLYGLYVISHGVSLTDVFLRIGFAKAESSLGVSPTGKLLWCPFVVPGALGTLNIFVRFGAIALASVDFEMANGHRNGSDSLSETHSPSEEGHKDSFEYLKY